MDLTSLYLHFPFCKHRCAYCDFITYAGIEELIPEYVNALCREVDWISRSTEERIPVHTVYFGGGTPSLLSLLEVEKILQTIENGFSLQPEVEITIEVNPGTISLEYLDGIIKLGINRLSIGMQTAHESELHLLERIHSFSEVVRTVTWARKAGLDNLNLDLIYGLPEQSLNNWSISLEAALDLQPKHLSLYALTLDENVPLAIKIKQGVVAAQDTDLAADMYELAENRLAKAGFESYEISNWSIISEVGKGYTCQHNLQYWKGKPYLGLGAGAHGYINHMRTMNEINPRAYITLMEKKYLQEESVFPVSPVTSDYKLLSFEDEMGEFMMMGLRLTQEGVSVEEFGRRFGQDLEEIYRSHIDRLIHWELLEWANGTDRHLRLTQRGRLLGNQVFCEFI